MSKGKFCINTPCQFFHLSVDISRHIHLAFNPESLNENRARASTDLNIVNIYVNGQAYYSRIQERLPNK
jgi:hypothetical protein